MNRAQLEAIATQRKAQRQAAHDQWVNEMVGKAIPIDRLIPGRYYKGDGRNFNLARWDGKVFRGRGFTCGHYYIEVEEYGCFYPMQIIGDL